jgi:hypothetical protein
MIYFNHINMIVIYCDDIKGVNGDFGLYEGKVQLDSGGLGDGDKDRMGGKEKENIQGT